MANEFARRLRRGQTETEKEFWSKVRNRAFGDHKFRRQHPIGRFIADFVCLDAKLVIELDGGQHLQQQEKDAARTAWLDREGYMVLRFWDNQVFKEWEGVAETVWRALTDRSPEPRGMRTVPLTPTPLPQGERGLSEEEQR